MELIDQIRVSRSRGERADALVQLLCGDLSAIPAEHAVDLLVVSAFPESYGAHPGTLFESLYARGLDMHKVAERKSEDERKRLGCWLSEPMSPDIVKKLHFLRILCFEPSHSAFTQRSQRDDIAANVGVVFRCLNNFVIPDLNDARNFEIAKVAMPVLATGNQRVPLEVMFPRLLEAAIFWLQEGLPIQELKIVVFQQEHLLPAKQIFSQAKSSRHPVWTRWQSPDQALTELSWEAQLSEKVRRAVIETCKEKLLENLMAAATVDEKRVLEQLLERTGNSLSSGGEGLSEAGAVSPDELDFFISYAHDHDAEVKQFVEAMKQQAPHLKIFYDRDSIPVGGQWIRMISDAVQRTRKFIAILSPQYSASPVCWDEFQCAKLKEYNTRQSVILTIRWLKEKELPPIMGIYSYEDCSEGDLKKLKQAATKIIK